MSSTNEPAKPLAPISRAACIGGGVIGGGWIARFFWPASMSGCSTRIRRRNASSAR